MAPTSRKTSKRRTIGIRSVLKEWKENETVMQK